MRASKTATILGRSLFVFTNLAARERTYDVALTILHEGPNMSVVLATRAYGQNHFPANVYPKDPPQLQKQIVPLKRYAVEVRDGEVWVDVERGSISNDETG